MNEKVSGQQWKCPNCELFLSVLDLEYCTLTEKALKNFGERIEMNRHMVEYQEDKSMHLLPAVKPRGQQGRSKGSGSSNSSGKNGPHGGNGGAEEIVII